MTPTSPTPFRPISLALSLLFTLLAVSLLVAIRIDLTPNPYTAPQIEVVAEGLLAPIGMAALPDGSILIAEEGTGGNNDSGGVSLLTADGRIGRLVSGLPSSLDSGDLAGVPLVALSPDGDMVYIGNFAQGHLWTLPLTPDQQTSGLSIPERALTPDQLGTAMHPLNNVRLVNPFDLTFDADGVPVVADASHNGIATENPDGTTRFIHRFAQLPNRITPADTIEAVPTGITRVGSEYYVTLTGGCPFPPESGMLVAIDENRNQRTVVYGLNMPIDIAQGPDGTLWLLEFARFTSGASCFDGSGYQRHTGRLSRVLPNGSLDVVLDDLDSPGAVLPMPDGSLYISEVRSGRILHITFGLASQQPAPTALPYSAPPAANRRPIDPADYDALLAEATTRLDLHPNPGSDQREGDTPLARLGQMLFFDPLLSGDRNIACATCHHPALAMADGLPLPVGTGGHGLGPERIFIETITLNGDATPVRIQQGRADPLTGQAAVPNPFIGQFVPRNSPSVLNAALFPAQFWDSRIEIDPLTGYVHTPEDAITALQLDDPLTGQALFPVTSTHEMAGVTLGELSPQTIRRALLERLRANPEYVALFAAAYGPDTPITMEQAAAAIAAFERQFIFTDAPWDAYLSGDHDALTAQQKQGALLFFGQLDPAVNCAQCHSGDLFSDFEHYNLLVPQLGPGKGHGESKREDWGRAGVTFSNDDRYTFRTPSLRNVELTAPYFHDGSYLTLEATIRHHADIGGMVDQYDPSTNGVPPALFSSLQYFQPEKQWQTAAPPLRNGLPLNDEDIAALVAFLTTLTDPAARDLSAFIPAQVPSGLALDPLPNPATVQALRVQQQPEAAPGVAAAPAPSDALTASGPLLHDVAAEVGLDFQHGAFQQTIYPDPVAMMGAGLCWLDYDNDGWLDLYLVNSHAEDEADYWQQQGGLPTNRLYHNTGGQFTDTSQASGTDLALRGNGCVAADFNRDGWWDIYVTADGPNALLWNNGDGTFSEGAAGAGIAAPEWNSAAAVADLNGDGWPDLFVAGYIDLDYKVPNPVGLFPQDYYGIPDHLYLSEGLTSDGRVTFREVTQAAGLLHNERGLGALFTDVDLDGDLDLYIANDGQSNRLYINQPWPGGIEADPEGIGFRFSDATDNADVGDSGSGMGIAGGDYDGDGLIDLFVTNWEREVNALYRNLTAEGDAPDFLYSTFRIGLSRLGNGMTGWGTAWLDYDHDTDQDLLIAHGRVPVTNLETDPELVRLYRNRSWEADGTPGSAGQFTEWTQPAGLGDLGPLLARGSAVADYDNDGDLDIAINTIAGPVVLLENNGADGNWLLVDLADFQPGTRVVATLPGGRQLVREVYAGSSYLASEDPRVHFGLGRADYVARLEVIWPDGERLVLDRVDVNQILHITPE